MKNLKLYMLALITVLLSQSSCKEDDDSEAVTLPANLTFDVSIDKGIVAVTASAEKVNFYNIYFGDVTNETPVKVTDGKATHTYKVSGNYTIKVQAHVTATSFITETKQITIDLGDHQPGPNDIIIPTTGYVSPETYESKSLVWEDNFDGTSVNTDFWTFETGRGTDGWGNNELQYYRAENTTLQDGYLIITAKKESYQGAEYTSSRLVTKGKKEFQYGRIDIRAALPKGQGIWPALWMLGSNFPGVSWPACGEIDIMEMIGGSGRENTVHGTIHWDNNGQNASYGQPKTLGTGTFNDEFHVFSLEWNANSMTWYVDNIQFNVVDLTPAHISEFREHFFLIFNVAVGGNWPGNPDAGTVFPQHMIVDYIRVFQ